jgi:hypothetical protein
MMTIVKECGELLKRMDKQKQAAEKWPDREKQIYADMITEYQEVMLRMEKSFGKQDIRRYLEIRRARYAVAKGFEKVVPIEILYHWLVENICDLETG